MKFVALVRAPQLFVTATACNYLKTARSGGGVSRVFFEDGWTLAALETIRNADACATALLRAGKLGCSARHAPLVMIPRREFLPQSNSPRARKHRRENRFAAIVRGADAVTPAMISGKNRRRLPPAKICGSSVARPRHIAARHRGIKTLYN